MEKVHDSRAKLEAATTEQDQISFELLDLLDKSKSKHKKLKEYERQLSEQAVSPPFFLLVFLLPHMPLTFAIFHSYHSWLTFASVSTSQSKMSDILCTAQLYL